ncbi:MAG: hypothetical protein HZB82_07580 [Deltaproteobacteria bacterium]|nr:hypothetical protein [Deltaproteobacteria bacterium]
MTITELIKIDILTLRNYFTKLFDLENRILAFNQEQRDAASNQPYYYQEHSIAQFIKPDMVCNIYSLIDFWMKELCRYQKEKSKLALGSKDIKGENDLDAYQKYLTKVAAVDLNAVKNSYESLQSLRKVRKKFIHDGGHILDNSDTTISNIKGVRLAGSLIVIDESFIWESLKHAEVYLCAIAQNMADGR